MTDYMLWIFPLAVLLIPAVIKAVGWLRARRRYQNVTVVQKVRNLEQYEATLGGRFPQIVVDATLTENEMAEGDTDVATTGRHEQPASDRVADLR